MPEAEKNKKTIIKLQNVNKAFCSMKKLPKTLKIKLEKSE